MVNNTLWFYTILYMISLGLYNIFLNTATKKMGSLNASIYNTLRNTIYTLFSYALPIKYCAHKFNPF